MNPRSYFKNKTIFLAGGTGSWGQELTRQLLLSEPKEIRIFSRGEHAQVKMMQEFDDPRISFYLGDVRDRDRLIETMNGVDIAFHLAALKHVPVCERHILETVRTNILGTQNFVEAAKANKVAKAIYTSSDKAVSPVNVYGHTKALSEKIFTTANVFPPTTTAFSCIRAGNVIGTHGSVVPLFSEQVRKFNKVMLTDERMTRFFMPVSDMISFLIEIAIQAKGGEIFIPKMPAVRIPTLAKVIIKALGDERTTMTTTGIRPGEKIHELLISHEETPRTMKFSDHFVVFPYTFLIKDLPQLASYSRDGEKVNDVYSSENASHLEEEKVLRLLNKSGFLKNS